MTRQGFDQYAPNERNPSVCACADENDAKYYGQDLRGSVLRLYGDGNGNKYSLTTLLIVALVALVVGYICKWLDIPMRFFSAASC